MFFLGQGFPCFPPRNDRSPVLPFLSMKAISVFAPIGEFNGWTVFAVTQPIMKPLLRAIRSLNGRSILTMLLSELEPTFLTVGVFNGRAVIRMKNAMENTKALFRHAQPLSLRRLMHEDLLLQHYRKVLTIR